MLAVVAQLLPFHAREEGDDAGDLFEYAVGGVVGLGVLHAIHEFDDDSPVGLGSRQRLPHLSHALNSSFTIGEGTLFFEGGGAGQDDVGHFGGLGHEDLLTDQEFQTLQCLSDPIGVGIGLDDVLPDDPEGPELAVDGGPHHLGSLVSHSVGDAFDAIELVVFPMVFGKGHIQVSRPLMGLTTHIGGALYVVLPPQGIDAGAGFADVTGDHGERGDKLDGSRTLPLLGDPQAMEFHGGPGRPVGAGGLFDQFFIDAGDARHGVHVDGEDLVPEIVPSFDPGVDEFPVDPALAREVVKHHIEERHIGSGARLQMIAGVSGEFGPPRIDDDAGDALQEFLLDPGPGDGVGVGGIGADDQNAVRGVQIGDGIGGRAGAEGALQAQGGGGMTDAGAAIDIVGSDDRAHEFLHEVVFLIGAAGGRDAGDGVGAAGLFDTLEFGDDAVIGRFPGHRFELPVAAPDEGGTQAIRVIEIFEGVAPLEARMTPVHLGVEGRPNGDDFIVDSGDLQVAPHAAVGAHRSRCLFRADGLGLEHIGNGRRGTGLRAGPATDAVGFGEGLIHSLGDVTVETPPRHGQYELPLYFVAGPHAPIAADALAEIGAEIGMGGVFLRIQVILATGIADLPNADLGGHPLQLAISVRLADEAIQGMVGEDQFDDVPAQPLHVGGIGVYVLAFLDLRVTRGRHAPGTTLLLGHLHRTEPTRAEGREVGGVAEGRDVVMSGAPREVEDGFVFFDWEGGVVYIGCEGHGF